MTDRNTADRDQDPAPEADPNIDPEPGTDNGTDQIEDRQPNGDSTTTKQSSYLEKIVKYVPAPIIAAYVAGIGIINEQPDNPIWLYWAAFLSLWALTPLYIIFLPGEHTTSEHNSKRYHVLAGTISFAVWVFALGDPFKVTFDWYRPVFGSLVLIITTLTLPILEQIANRISYFKVEQNQ